MRIKDVASLEEEAVRFLNTLSPRVHEATLITLSGELGAGKTAFVKGLARGLGVDVPVTSPTFVIMKKYTTEHPGFKHLVHIDAYRLKGAHHLSVLGWEEILTDRHALICLEWPEQCPGAIPKSAIRIALRYSGEHEREITYTETREEETRTS